MITSRTNAITSQAGGEGRNRGGGGGEYGNDEAMTTFK
jgi:hypothetical protein